MIIDKAIISAVRTGQMTKKELVNELLRSNNVMELAEALADYVINEEEPTRPIPISREDYERIISLFRIRGLRSDGTFENRGKRRLDSKE